MCECETNPFAMWIDAYHIGLVWLRTFSFSQFACYSAVVGSFYCWSPSCPSPPPYRGPDLFSIPRFVMESSSFHLPFPLHLFSFLHTSRPTMAKKAIIIASAICTIARSPLLGYSICSILREQCFSQQLSERKLLQRNTYHARHVIYPISL